jgi:hypothetical protein
MKRGPYPDIDLLEAKRLILPVARRTALRRRHQPRMARTDHHNAVGSWDDCTYAMMGTNLAHRD